MRRSGSPGALSQTPVSAPMLAPSLPVPRQGEALERARKPLRALSNALWSFTSTSLTSHAQKRGSSLIFPSPGHTSSPWTQEKATCGVEFPVEPPTLSQTMQFVKVASSEDTPSPEFPEIVQFVKVASPQDTPSPEFPEIVQLVRVGEESRSHITPPTEFPEIVQLVRVGEEFQQDTPPPSAEFPEIVQLVRVGEEFRQDTPPP